MQEQVETVRFAPSPTGRLHLGHAYAAAYADEARQSGRYLLRIEDIERDRVRKAYVEGILADLDWLGLQWEEPVLFQSARSGRYDQALRRLALDHHVYPCFCSRRQVAEETERVGAAPHGPLPFYPGTCRGLPQEEVERRAAAGEEFAYRLDVGKALDRLGPVTWHDRRRGVQSVPRVCDPIIARRDIGTSYHLSSVVDDADQGVTLVTRGSDLFESTHVHRLVQGLLGLPVPEYDHHPLVGDESGERLSKRDGSITLEDMRGRGLTPTDVLELGRARLIPGT